MAYRTLRFTFSPFTFTSGEEQEVLSVMLATQGVPSIFALQAHRRRGAWSSTLPPGVFDGDYRSNAATWEQHLASRDRITMAAAAGLPRKQRPIPRRYDVLEHGGQLYYHPEAIRVYAQHVDHPAFLRALARCLEAAERNPALIVPPRAAARFVPLEQRSEVYGKVVRGPDWAPEEDQVLRRWFGQRSFGEHAGHHVTLTADEWAAVLKELPRRNKNGVRNRIVELNKQLRIEFVRDGFVALDRLPTYMSRVLGERPRIPIRPTRRRPRPNAL